jgi:hypothetical protein
MIGSCVGGVVDTRDECVNLLPLCLLEGAAQSLLDVEEGPSNLVEPPVACPLGPAMVDLGPDESLVPRGEVCLCRPASGNRPASSRNSAGPSCHVKHVREPSLQGRRPGRDLSAYVGAPTDQELGSNPGDPKAPIQTYSPDGGEMSGMCLSSFGRFLKTNLGVVVPIAPAAP